jgi:hypothetical protein
MTFTISNLGFVSICGQNHLCSSNIKQKGIREMDYETNN